MAELNPNILLRLAPENRAFGFHFTAHHRNTHPATLAVSV